jgi:hypothetical protein
MKNQIENIKKVRTFLLEGIKDLTTEQLNKIPDGFNNNIIWNLGHMIAAQQGICYKRAGLDFPLGDDFWEAYRSGSKPGDPVDEAGIENIKLLFLSTLNQTEADYDNNIFSNYTAWTTRYGVEITNIDTALDFIPFHEGLHSGTIMALGRLV